MANRFKLHTFNGNSTASNVAMQVYVAPAGTTTVVIGLSIANTTDASFVFVDVKINNADGNQVYLVKNAPIPQGGAIEVMAGNKIVLEPGDGIFVYSNLSNSVDSIISVMEQS